MSDTTISRVQLFVAAVGLAYVVGDLLYAYLRELRRERELRRRQAALDSIVF